jgi:DNA polymerase-2
LETGRDFFILTADAVDRDGHCEFRYRVTGRDGPALLRVAARPVFFIPADTELPSGLSAERKTLDLVSFDGKRVDGLYFSTLGALAEGRRLLTDAGTRTFESDIRGEDRHLMERFICGSVCVDGTPRVEGGSTVYENPVLRSSDYRPQLTTMSLDIETGRDGTLYSIAMDISGPSGGRRAVGVRDEAVQGREGRAEPAARLPDEAALIRFFIDTVMETDPDVLIGWHVIGFDLSFLDSRSRALRIPLRIGRGGGILRLAERPGSLTIANLDGRLVIDGPTSLRGAFHRFSDWRLDTVARELLGRGKDIESHGSDKVDEIERRFREDKGALARYNLEDAVLVTEIFQRTGVLEQMVTRSLITGLPADQVHRSVAAFDRFFLPRLHRKGYVAPNQSDITAGSPAPGGKVFSGGAGLFEDVAVLDFKSLYPTVIRTFHIDPYSLIRADEHPLDTPAGIRFSRSEHILPSYLGELMNRRARARAESDAPLAQAVKILMNSMYGVMGSPGCRFYRSELPAAITGIGRWVLDTTTQRLEAWGYRVLYGDTDSVFVKLKTEERQDPDKAGGRLAARVDEYFRETILREYGVPSLLEMEYEKRYVKLFLPVMRTGGEAAVKRYAGLLHDGSLEIKGMEFVRSDSTALARDFQYELFRRFFAGEDLPAWIRDVVERLKNGEYDSKLVYRKRLSRPAREYQSPPPHVRAVMMLDPDGSRDLREVAYLMTPSGPVPLELGPEEIDYSHYIDKQLRSVADDILAQQGESFDAVVGGKQLDLF